MKLSDEQISIVNHEYGNAVVVAGAGSGKTKCLIERTAQLIENGHNPNSILIFTFTKKAANEITTRLKARIGDQSDSVTTCTIHSLAIKIIREFYVDIGYTQRPTVWTMDKINKLAGNIFSDQVNESSDISTIRQTIKNLEESLKKDDNDLFNNKTQKEKANDIAENLHEMKIRLSKRLGDSLADHIGQSKSPALGDHPALSNDYAEVKSSESGDVVSKIKTPKMLREIESLSQKQKQMYLYLDFDSPEEIKKMINSHKKSFTEILHKKMRPIPRQISGIEIDEYREELRNKFKDSGKWEFVIGLSMKVLNIKQSCSAIEFDDMVPGACRILDLNPDNPYCSKFEHIMVDEYQDVNNDNVRFITALSQNSSSLMAVGDDDQAVYAFRGGNTEHILSFPTRFNASIYYLTTNYRCTETIVDAANKVIQNNKNRFPKRMVAFKKETDPKYKEYALQTISPRKHYGYQNTIKWQAFGSDANFKFEVFDMILQELHGQIGFMDLNPSEIAILARNNYQLTQFNIWSKRVQNGLPLKDRIKFQNLSDVSVFNNKIVDKIHNWFNYIINPTDFISLRDALMSTVKGFGDSASLHLMDAAQENKEGGIEAWFGYLFEQKRHGKKTALGKRLSNVLNVYKEIMLNIQTMNVYDIFTKVLNIIGLPLDIICRYKSDIEQDTYFGDFSTPGQKEKATKKKIDQNFGQKLMLYEYDSAIKSLTGLVDLNIAEVITEEEEDPFDDPFYVPELEEKEEVVRKEINKEDFYGLDGLTKWMDEVRTESELEKEKDGVVLGTIHSSKGKEWKLVIIIGLIDGIMPSSKNTLDPEEERRLMYVGMTRAEETLILSWDIESKRSPFIEQVFGSYENLTEHSTSTPSGWEHVKPKTYKGFIQ